MKALNVIKAEFGRIKGISLYHLILAVTAASLMTVLAVMRPPMDHMSLSPLGWISLLLTPSGYRCSLAAWMARRAGVWSTW